MSHSLRKSYRIKMRLWLSIVIGNSLRFLFLLPNILYLRNGLSIIDRFCKTFQAHAPNYYQPGVSNCLNSALHPDDIFIILMSATLLLSNQAYFKNILYNVQTFLVNSCLENISLIFYFMYLISDCYYIFCNFTLTV